jgi:hypothetical protein
MSMHVCTLCVHAVRLLCVPVYVLFILLIFGIIYLFSRYKRRFMKASYCLCVLPNS